MKTTKRLRALLAVLAIACVPASLAGWEQQAIDVGGMPGQYPAFSSATSRAYIPLLQQKALAVFDGTHATRLELDIKPTTIAYSAATGRLFIAGMFDDALIVMDEATGAQTRLNVGSFPDRIVVDDARGKVFVSNWGGITAQGSVSVVDMDTLAVRNVPLGGVATGMAHNASTGHVFVLGGDRGSNGFLVSIESEGRVAARVNGLGYQALSLAVDSRNGRLYVAGLSHPAYLDPANVERIFQIYSADLQLLDRQAWPSGGDWAKLNFLIDPARPGLYFSSGGSDTLLWLDADGANLKTWQLPMGSTQLADGRTVLNGLYGLDADPATGRIFVSSPVGGLVAEFDPATSATHVVGIPGAVGFNAVHFWPDSSRVLVTDAANEHQLTLLRRLPQAD